MRPIISIINKNNNNNNNNNDDDDNDNNNNNNNNNNSLNGFEQALIDCAFKSSMLTSAVAFWLQTQSKVFFRRKMIVEAS